MDNKKKLLLFIFVVIIASAWVVFTRPIKKGLDLVGGSRITLEAQTTDTIAQITPDMMDSLKFAIEKRVNSLGISEVPVQKAGENRLIIEIPNVADPEQARAYVGDTAELEFKEPKEVAGGGIEWVSTGLTGNDLRKANVETDTAGQWVVSLEFNDKGTMKFAELTKRLVGKQMAIFFNGKEESAPVIREPITAGRAQISGGADGGFPYDEAKQMVDLLNAGALPIPAKIIEENVVGPTLGADSIDKSKTAGMVGLGLVAIFMLLLYRVPGMIANVALCIYALIVFAIFKLVGVTLTLAGIAGFILSIGMAVDANILIFERTKEELRSGKRLLTAVKTGFDRAFTSIFDSNMTTLITCGILCFTPSSPSIVKGFAITLAIGVAVSMFTAITVSRSLMELILSADHMKHPNWFGLKNDELSAAIADEQKVGKAKLGVLD